MQYLRWKMYFAGNNNNALILMGPRLCVQVREGEVPPLPDDPEPASAVPHLRRLPLWELSKCMLQVSWNTLPSHDSIRS
jgi:hypothetical protein